MVLKSYAKINLSLNLKKRLKNGLHDLKSVYCLIDLNDKISIKKLKNKNKDQIFFKGPYSKFVNRNNNSVKKVLHILRKQKLISAFYSVKVYKNIPVFAGLGGGTSNAATILKNLAKKKLIKSKLNKITKFIGSDLTLFFHNQGYLKNVETAKKFDKKYKLYFLLVYPNIKCSTKEVFSRVKRFSRSKNISQTDLKSKKKFIDFLINSNNDLQSIVEKKHSIIQKMLKNIAEEEGCYFSRMTGSGSTCYGLFVNKNCSKVALKNLRKKYPKFWFSIAKTI